MCGEYKGWGKLAGFSNTELYPIGFDCLIVAIISKRPNHPGSCICPTFHQVSAPALILSTVYPMLFTVYREQKQVNFAQKNIKIARILVVWSIVSKS